MLHALIERRERVVTKNELLDVVWPGLVVEENNLQVQISSLRKLLGPVIEREGTGYVVRVDESSLDSLEFESLLLGEGVWSAHASTPSCDSTISR